MPKENIPEDMQFSQAENAEVSSHEFEIDWHSPSLLPKGARKVRLTAPCTPHKKHPY